MDISDKYLEELAAIGWPILARNGISASFGARAPDPGVLFVYVQGLIGDRVKKPILTIDNQTLVDEVEKLLLDTDVPEPLRSVPKKVCFTGIAQAF